MRHGCHTQRALPGLLCAQPSYCFNCPSLAVSCVNVWKPLVHRCFLLGIEETHMGSEVEIQCHAVEAMSRCQLPVKATGIGGMMLSSHQGACELGPQLWGYVL